MSLKSHIPLTGIYLHHSHFCMLWNWWGHIAPVLCLFTGERLDQHWGVRVLELFWWAHSFITHDHMICYEELGFTQSQKPCSPWYLSVSSQISHLGRTLPCGSPSVWHLPVCWTGRRPSWTDFGVTDPVVSLQMGCGEEWKHVMHLENKKRMCRWDEEL